MKKTIIKFLLLNIAIFSGFAWYIIKQPLATQLPVYNNTIVQASNSYRAPNGGDITSIVTNSKTNNHRTAKAVSTSYSNSDDVSAMPYSMYNVNTEPNASLRSSSYSASVSASTPMAYSTQRNKRNESNIGAVTTGHFPLIVQNTSSINRPLNGGTTTVSGNTSLLNDGNTTNEDAVSNMPDRQKNPPTYVPIGDGLLLLLLFSMLYGIFFIKRR